MRNIRQHFLLAFAIVFVALATFMLNALAEPQIFDSPQILADTDKSLVLRDNINGTETAYNTVYDALYSIMGKSGNFTLYFMRDYTVNNSNDFINQKGTYTLLVRSAGNNTYTYKSTKYKHFQLEDLGVIPSPATLRNKYENIILDGGQKNFVPTKKAWTRGGITLNRSSEITIGKGCVIQNCYDPGYSQSSPIYAAGEHTKVIVEDGAKFINNITKEYPRFGVITVYYGTLEINGGEFIGNYSGNMGGLITCDEAKSVTIKNATFKDNDSDGEGTVYLFRSNADIDNCTFINNHGHHGGAVKAYSYNDSKINISNCKFFTNGCEAGGAISASDCEVTVKNCLFKNNYVHYYYGGAINVDQEANLKVYDSEFLENGPHKFKAYYGEIIEYCPRQGGAISVSWRAKAEIKNCLFKGNIAEDSGGAIYTYKFTNKNAHDDYAEIQEADAYDNLKIDDKTQFIDNYVRNGYFAPPLNFEDFKELKFKSNSFTGKGYPTVLSLDKTLLNNYDVNYAYDAYIYIFDANGGMFRNGGSLADENLFYTTRVNKDREYKISNIQPVKANMIFFGWKDEDGTIHKIGETLPPARQNRIFKAVWEPHNGLIPQTGDNSNIALYVVLAVVAVGIFGFINSKNKRNK